MIVFNWPVIMHIRDKEILIINISQAVLFLNHEFEVEKSRDIYAHNHSTHTNIRTQNK